jgi:hypothetical protein
MRPAILLPRSEWPRILADYDALDPKTGGGWVKSARRSYIKSATGMSITDLRKILQPGEVGK